MKKVFIVHCWDGNCNDGWYPWIDKNLTNENTKVIRFDMPNTENPTIKEWTQTLNNIVKELDEETFFLGHSIGCQTILRYLESKNQKIGGILFVCPWLDLLPEAISDKESYDIAYPWIHTPIKYKNILKCTSNIHCIFSDNDYWVSIKQEKEFKEKLLAKTYIVKGKGHISQDDGIYELQEILNISKKMMNEV